MGDGGGWHWLVQMERRPARWSVCLPLSIFPCTIKSRSSLLAPAHPGGPGKRAVKWLCVFGVVCHWSVIRSKYANAATQVNYGATQWWWVLHVECRSSSSYCGQTSKTKTTAAQVNAVFQTMAPGKTQRLWHVSFCEVWTSWNDGRAQETRKEMWDGWFF